MATTAEQKKITLFQLSNSRALRIAWLLEELHLPYKIVTGSRLPSFDADPEWRAQAGGLGKAPTIHDGDLILQESGAIVDVPTPRAKVREFTHMAEGLFLLHAYPVFASRRLPTEIHTSANVGTFRSLLAGKVFQDMEWLEGHLKAQKALAQAQGIADSGLFLVGTDLTAADVMMGFSAQLILSRIVKADDLVERREEYSTVEEWLGGLMKRPALRLAMKKTGFTG